MKRPAVFLLLGLASLFLPTWENSSWADGGPWEGLDPCISWDLPERMGYVEYESTALTPRAEPPLVSASLSSIEYDVFKERVWSRAPFDFDAVMKEQHFAWLPPTNPAEVEGEAGPKQIWRFPVGTTFVHRMRLKDAQSRIHDTRILRRMADGRWAFGIYDERAFASGRCGLDELELRTNEKPMRSVEWVNQQGYPSWIRYKPLTPTSCTLCHSMSGDQENHTCGFRWDAEEDINRIVARVGEWSDRFIARYGSSPFVSAGSRVPVRPHSVADDP